MKSNVYENITDILKPKSYDEIDKDFENIKKLIDKAFILISNSNNYRVISRVGFSKDELYSYYGFRFRSKKIIDIHRHEGEYANYIFGFFPDLGGIYLIFENNGFDKKINDLKDFRISLDLKINESDISNIFKAKSKSEIIENIPKEKKEIIEDCYEIISQFPERFIITKDIDVYTENWGRIFYGFEFERHRPYNYKDLDVNYIKRTANRYRLEISEKEVVLWTFNEEGGYDKLIENPYDFMISMNLYNPIKESKDIKNIFKPKSKKELKIEFEKKYPIFIEILEGLFPNEDYNLNIEKEGFQASFAFRNNDIMFLVSQGKFFNFPTISYLDNSKKSHGFGGVFRQSKSIHNINDVFDYIEDVIKMT